MTDQPQPKLNAGHRLLFRTFARTLPEVAEHLIGIACQVSWDNMISVQSGHTPQWSKLPENEREARRQALRTHMRGNDQ